MKTIFMIFLNLCVLCTRTYIFVHKSIFGLVVESEKHNHIVESETLDVFVDFMTDIVVIALIVSHIALVAHVVVDICAFDCYLIQ